MSNLKFINWNSSDSTSTFIFFLKDVYNLLFKTISKYVLSIIYIIYTLFNE